MINRPLVGLTTYREQTSWGPWATNAAALQAHYLDKVDAADGVPLLLPPPAGNTDGDAIEARARAVVAGLDAVVVTGGADLDPELYGQGAHPMAGPPQPMRDRWELALIRAAGDRRLPALFICRGTQLLNVVRGGTLHQHLPDHVGHDRHLVRVGQFGLTQVTVTSGSHLASIVGDAPKVMCSHHQAIDRVGDGLTVVATADDDTVEAVEGTGPDFLVGVQWHPEMDDHAALFAALVAATEGAQREIA